MEHLLILGETPRLLDILDRIRLQDTDAQIDGGSERDSLRRLHHTPQNRLARLAVALQIALSQASQGQGLVEWGANSVRTHLGESLFQVLRRLLPAAKA